jgi:hypothetical protein
MVTPTRHTPTSPRAPRALRGVEARGRLRYETLHQRPFPSVAQSDPGA